MAILQVACANNSSNEYVATTPYKGTLLACGFRRFGEIMRLVSGDGFSIPLSEIGLKKFPFSIIPI